MWKFLTKEGAAKLQDVGSPAMVKLWDSVDAGVSLPVASITTPSLPQTFRHLKVIAQILGSTANAGIILRLNGSVTNYYWTEFQAHGGNLLSDGDGPFPDTSFSLGNIGGFMQRLDIDLPVYSDQVGGGGKTIASENTYIGALSAGQIYIQKVNGVWQVNQPISTITFATLAGTFVAGTRFGVYGIL
jgi:hypothetical protein